MTVAGRWRWERALLLVAVVLGVVTMHATVAPAAMLDATTSAMTGTAMAAASETPGVEHAPEPMPAAHELLHLCLAVLAAAIVFGLALVVTILTRRDRDTPDPGPREVVLVEPRPPPRTAVRLAQLCVLRN